MRKGCGRRQELDPAEPRSGSHAGQGQGKVTLYCVEGSAAAILGWGDGLSVSFMNKKGPDALVTLGLKAAHLTTLFCL